MELMKVSQVCSLKALNTDFSFISLCVGNGNGKDNLQSIKLFSHQN